MIPPLREIIAACRYLERRFEWEEPLEDEVFEDCHALAKRLAERQEDEPAALFFAFSRGRVFVADAYTVIPIVLCRNQASKLGYALTATRFALVDLKRETNVGLHSFEDVRAFFAARLAPGSPG